MDYKKIASIVSAVLNVPLITAVAFILLIFTQRTELPFAFIAVTTLFGSLLPVISVWGLLKINLIKTLYTDDKTTGIIPFLWSLTFYLTGAFTLLNVGAPPVVTALMACYFVNGLVLLLINFKWKVSIHAATVAGSVTALVFQLGFEASPLFLLVLAVGWARFELGVHDLVQIALGVALGSVLTWLQMGFYLGNAMF